MILVLKKAWAASSMISLLNLDSAIFSLSCLIPVPPVFGVPFKSMILSALFLTPSPFFSLATSSLTTSNSPLKRVSFQGSFCIGYGADQEPHLEQFPQDRRMMQTSGI